MKMNPTTFVLERWKNALYLAGILIVLAIFLRIFILPYKMNAIVQVNDAQNSQLQAFSSNFFALSKTQNASSRKNNPAERAIDTLERNETYSSFLNSLKERAKAGKTGWDNDGVERLESYLGTTILTIDPHSRKLMQKIKDLVTFTAVSTSEIKIVTSTTTPELTYFVGQEFLNHALKVLKNNESAEIDKVSAALVKQRDHFKSQFMKVTGELEKFQRKPENVISLASGNSLGTYLSDLMVRKNELELKIAENQRTIEFLGGTRAAHLAIARDLGQRSEIRQLMDETSLLKKQVGSLQSSINKITNQTGGTVEAMRMYEELKKSADGDFKNFQEANDILSKLVVYQISIDSKFELFQRPEFEDVRPAMASSTLIALALLLSQIIFSGWVYIQWMVLQKRREEWVEGMQSHQEAGDWVINFKKSVKHLIRKV